jgi:uncharacterized membrane protein
MSGALVPISMLPAWMQPASLALAPTWGVDAIKYSALEGYGGMLGMSLITDVLMCVALSIVFIFSAYVVMLYVERKVLIDGTATRY